MEVDKVNLYHGDCLIENEYIEDGSVDLILTDLPYGTFQNAGISDSASHGMQGKTDWDMAIEPEDVYKIANRILRKNGKMILFSQEPYTTKMISEAFINVPVSYRMIWLKDHFANSLIAKKAPVSYFEDVIVFSKSYEDTRDHPLIRLFNESLEKSAKDRAFFFSLVGSSASHYFTKGLQFRIPTKEKYEAINKYLSIDKTHRELVEINESYKNETPVIFNLWEGNKYKSNILEYAKDYTGYHPTQKPVLLLEDLIKTFSNEGDLIVDLTMGSGSTGVACVNTNRKFTGIEMDDKYFNVARERIEETAQTNIFDFL